MPLPRLPLFVLFLLIALTGAGAANAGAEIPLAPPRFGPSSTTSFRSGTAIASSGHGYLVAWEEPGVQLYPSGTIMVRAFEDVHRTGPAGARGAHCQQIVLDRLCKRIAGRTLLPCCREN